MHQLILAAVLVPFVAGCNSETSNQDKSIDNANQQFAFDYASLSSDSLAILLGYTPGVLGESGLVAGNLTGPIRELALTVMERDSSVFANLVDCIGNMTPSLVVHATQRVAHGYVCALVLRSMIAHEETNSLGDEIPWAGYVSPDASSQDLRKAQSLWRHVITSGQYNRL
jgi:hypothetical protein